MPTEAMFTKFIDSGTISVNFPAAAGLGLVVHVYAVKEP
jgi:hypothetical protein